jgi:CHASE3 domain sensor protein
VAQKKRFIVSRKTRTVAALSVLAAAAATLTLAIREYRRAGNAVGLMYTQSVKKKDIVDAARNALSALNDAELRAQNYVLTGETVYSEAYADDLRAWQDESASLVLVARNDPATPLAQDLSKAGTRTLNELALVVSLFERSGRDAALERIRSSGAIVYMDQARNIVAKILEVDGRDVDGTYRLINRALSSFRRLAAVGGVLFLLVAAGILLLALEARRERQESDLAEQSLRPLPDLHRS